MPAQRTQLPEYMRTTRWGPGMPNRKQISRLRSAACELAFPLSGSFGMAVLFQFPNVAGCSHAVEGGKSTTKPCTWLALNEKKSGIQSIIRVVYAWQCLAVQHNPSLMHFFLFFFFYEQSSHACFLTSHAGSQSWWLTKEYDEIKGNRQHMKFRTMACAGIVSMMMVYYHS